jgi:glutamate/tyrosine decarboxylase-like PLP-dependent enzyme
VADALEPPEPTLSAGSELQRPVCSVDAFLASIHAALAEPGPVRPALSSEEVGTLLQLGLPELGCEPGELERELCDFARRAARRGGAPGFFGFICAPGLPSDPLAHALGAALNQNVASFKSAPGAAILEQRLISWWTRVVGLPRASGGAFVSGGSLGNFSALACALHARAGDRARENGVAGLELRVYASPEAHFSIERALRLLGLGSRSLRRIPTDADLRADPAALEQLIQEDEASGFMPGAVVASAGTTATGAIDPLTALADVAERHGLWLHVDAAYGGAALLAPDLAPRFRGIERASSVVIDLHKWLYLALDSSLLLLRDPSHAKRLFGSASGYAPSPDAGTSAEPLFLHEGLETSRRFRALPAYVALRLYGRRKLAENIAFNAANAKYLASLVKARSELELVNEPALSITCFRYVRAGESEASSNARNERIRAALQREGRFYLSPTELAGRTVLRVCVVSSATRPSDLRDLVARVLELGARDG